MLLTGNIWWTETYWWVYFRQNLRVHKTILMHPIHQTCISIRSHYLSEGRWTPSSLWAKERSGEEELITGCRTHFSSGPQKFTFRGSDWWNSLGQFWATTLNLMKLIRMDGCDRLHINLHSKHTIKIDFCSQHRNYPVWWIPLTITVLCRQSHYMFAAVHFWSHKLISEKASSPLSLIRKVPNFRGLYFVKIQITRSDSVFPHYCIYRFGFLWVFMMMLVDVTLLLPLV